MKKIIIFLFLSIFILLNPLYIQANDTIYVIPGGESIGLKIETGVEVVGKYSVQTNEGKINPWSNSKIEIGDYILEINNIKISNNDDLIKNLKLINDQECTLKIQRNDELLNTSILVVKTTQNEPSIGLYVKDKMLGIGTLSFVYNNQFASLGHGIYENNELIDIKKGDLTFSNVLSIKKATLAQAGEKRAALTSELIGQIKAIKNSGVYGTFDKTLNKSKVKLAKVNDVKTGEASIYTVLNGTKVEQFDVEIIEIKPQSHVDSKGIKIKVTDSTLISSTGGIVQGMSGSPIIQNGSLIGVVSHVTLENPTIGYAVYAEWMYNDLCA